MIWIVNLIPYFIQVLLLSIHRVKAHPSRSKKISWLVFRLSCLGFDFTFDYEISNFYSNHHMLVWVDVFDFHHCSIKMFLLIHLALIWSFYNWGFLKVGTFIEHFPLNYELMCYYSFLKRQVIAFQV